MNKSLFIFSLSFFFLLFASLIQAQDITHSQNQINEQYGQSTLLEIDAVTITHSTSQSILAGNSVSCNAGGLHADNSYYRAFNLADFGITDDFNVTMVEIGIEQATGAGGTQPITVYLYTSNPAFPGGFPGSLTQIGTADINVPDQALTILQIPVTGTAPVGSELVVEIFTPDGQTAGNTFFIGSNNLGETGPSYILSVDCAITTPTPTGSIGFPDMHIVMNVTGETGGPTVITIAEAIEDLDMDFIPDRLGQTVTVEGVVFSPNYQTGNGNNSFYIDDGTAGTDIFMYGPPLFNWAYGDMLQITGEVSQYNGMTEIIPADSSGWVFQSAGNPTPNPIVITLAQYKANSEMYEGSLVGFVSLDLVGGTWPAAGSSANLDLSDGVDTVVFRIDSDTDIPGQPEPTWPRDILGIGSQYDSSTPPDGGYQIFPRYYASDFLPPGTIPVELTSFAASVNPGSVTLSWSTASETNNQGFEIQRTIGSDFYTIGFVEGNGTTTEINNYSYTDRNLTAGNYSYRLKQIDFNGRYEYSNVINVDVAPEQFELSQNYPNPFNPSTTINFSIPQSSIVTLKVFNTLGQEVKTLVNQNMESGVHSISFDASELNSGIYFYKLDAGQFTEVRKMTLIK
ncbi:MAG: T9SS type A sorting domain-containing protein [Ignavibacteriaceae bacterium]|nr:T9SS type A sorting domain-containing protein [Ignavibacteriaceae bacterium]